MAPRGPKREGKDNEGRAERSKRPKKERKDDEGRAEPSRRPKRERKDNEGRAEQSPRAPSSAFRSLAAQVCGFGVSFFCLFFQSFLVLVFDVVFVCFWIVFGGHFGRFWRPSSVQDGS